MGGKYSICARNLDNKCPQYSNYYLSLFGFIFKGIYCLIKYDVVSLQKHG